MKWPTTVVQREIADDMKVLDETDIPKNCAFGAIVKNALKRALRIAEYNRLMGNLRTILILVVLIVVIKKDGVGIVDLLFKHFGP